MKGSRLDQLAAKHPEKAARVRITLQKAGLCRELQAMTKDEVIAYADEHDIEIDPEDSIGKIIKTIVRESFAVDTGPSYPDGDPSIDWNKAQLMAYADAHDIEYTASWTKQDILDAIEAAA